MGLLARAPSNLQRTTTVLHRSGQIFGWGAKVSMPIGQSSDGTQRGGKQPHAGRKPGSPFTRETALMYQQRATEAARFRRENPPPAILAALLLVASLVPLSKVAEQTGTKVATLRSWVKRYPAQLAAAEATLMGSAQQALSHLQPLAVKALTAALLSESPSRQEWAAGVVLKYRWPTAQTVPGGLVINATYVDYHPADPEPVPHIPLTIEHELSSNS